GSDKPQGAGGADATAVKRVRKDAPASAADGKGE
ncbi:MAG TPA: 30S ribosomal protein S3, partial [Giesbergeria sp.]|nr:30S ribosomal protein S3 [Giesbergeria sp.]